MLYLNSLGPTLKRKLLEALASLFRHIIKYVYEETRDSMGRMRNFKYYTKNYNSLYIMRKTCTDKGHQRLRLPMATVKVKNSLASSAIVWNKIMAHMLENYSPHGLEYLFQL